MKRTTTIGTTSLLLLLSWSASLSACRCESERPSADGATPSGRERQPLRAEALVAGGHHACARLVDGAIACWGSNQAGQLGRDADRAQLAPRRLAAPGEAAEVTAGFAATCFRLDEGSRRCWGRTHAGLPGAELPPALASARQLVLGRLHGCALERSGEVSCWGGDHFGQLGDGRAPGCGDEVRRGQQEPSPVPGVSGATAIAMGDTGTCALLEGGDLSCWGSVGLEPTGEGRPRCQPTPIEGLAEVDQVVLGSHHGCARRRDGTVWCWGANAIGQLGIMREGTTPSGPGGGGRSPRRGPTRVTGLDDVVELASFGRAHSCARRRGGQVLCWGRNNEGQLGDGTTTSRDAPVPVEGLDDALALAAGYDFTCALRRGGEVLCWGRNDKGQLGDGTGRDSPRPVPLAPVSL